MGEGNRMNKKLKINSFPRIHSSLIGMNNDGYRINGGIGFSISNPCLKISFEISANVEILDKREKPLNSEETKKLKDVINNTIKKCGFPNQIKCEIESGAPAHCGLGTTTAISLSCIEALFILNDREYSCQNIIEYSQRGGTSGIGINTYFTGGYIFDVGIKNDGRNLMPSSQSGTGGNRPLVIKQCELPNWEIGICIPCHIKNKTELEEIDFFRTKCPIERCDVENILYESLYGVTSSIIEKDYDVFCSSINAIQKTRWKSLERNIYGGEIIELERKIKEFGAECVGMSSLGPLLYFMGENISQTINRLQSSDCNLLCYETTFNNKERLIDYD